VGYAFITFCPGSAKKIPTLNINGLSSSLPPPLPQAHPQAPQVPPPPAEAEPEAEAVPPPAAAPEAAAGWVPFLLNKRNVNF
jgi:hypothetical protein